ncbi:hypothetical protein ACWDUL_09375 [Nocardia niigatensis]
MSSSTAAGAAFSPREGLRDSVIGPGERAPYLLRRAQRLTRPLMGAAVDTLPSELRVMAGYHLGWCDAGGVVIAGEPGRGLRPALVLAAASALGAAPDIALDAAAAKAWAQAESLRHVRSAAAMLAGRPDEDLPSLAGCAAQQ